MERLNLYLAVFFFTVIFLTSSCALRTGLNTAGAGPGEVQGTFTLILYGCNYLNDLETVAILDKEGDRYIIEAYAPTFNYRIKKGVPPKEALDEAEMFINCNSSYSRPQLRKILDNNGNIIGYEMRPLYLPFAYGVDDVLDTFYWIKDNKVYVSVRLKPSVENTRGDGNRSRGRD